MADFTHTFALSVVLDDGRTFAISNSDELTGITGVIDGMMGSNEPPIYGPGAGSEPEVDADPVLTIVQCKSGYTRVKVTNSASDVANVDLMEKQMFIMHGPEAFEVDGTPANATNAEEIESIDFSDGSAYAQRSYIVLIGATS